MPTLPSLRGSLRAATAFAAALVFVVAVPHGAFAAPGDLDTTFGTGGKVTVDGAFSDGQDLAVQADGRIVTVGARQDPDTFYADFSVMRHNVDGSVDTTFGGGDGEVLTDFEQGEDRAQGVTLQPDGKIVVVGRTQRTADEFAGCCWLTVARYNADGSLDTTFGGTGWVVPELAGGAEEGWAVAVQPDGKILAAGSAGGTFTAVRFNANGTLDPTFDGDGKVLTSFQDVGGAQGFDMALQPNGKFVIVGYSGETSFDFALARYNSDGSLDTSFSGDGRVTTDLGGYNWGRTVAVQSTGKIVASGSSGGNFTLVRYNVDGTLDSGFGTGGVVTTAFGSNSGVEALLLQPDDRIVAAGTAAGGDFALARYQVDGALDTGFGTGGKTTTDFGIGDVAHNLALQSDGKILAFGSNSDGDRALARYLGGAGSPPPPTGVDLSVTKTGTGTVSIGDRATYTVTVTNNSTSTSATGVSLTDTLTGPAATLISATPGQGTCTTSATGATCALGTLPAGAQRTVTIVVEPRATGTLTDRATVTATPTDPATANNTATATTTVNNSRGCTITGTSGNDTLNGGYGNDVICGLGGNDTINASYGNDTAYGNFGDDRVDGGFSDDTLNGGPGNDNLIGNYGNDRLNTVDSVSGNDTANGGFSTDTCTTDTGDIRISCP
ncbi:calcium-binding protein [Streptomyces sp. NBC_00243]|uniref:calcium-binding protein n=1 Tax=Streptomyces sp. NBC_00243 TaxID=2975688 RepID=UPI002DDB42A2|nr:calcium-binding protein [Streptomyces sp. NBC_00243]WRZ19008.1 calcium-binding protein [Streptomyces sp. NBC_00243]